LGLGQLAASVIAELDADGERVAFDRAAAGAVWARGDAGGVAQILRILLDIALRFAPAGRAVTVRLSAGIWRGGWAESCAARAAVDTAPDIGVRSGSSPWQRMVDGDVQPGVAAALRETQWRRAS
jgi:hypothetical protein